MAQTYFSLTGFLLFPRGWIPWMFCLIFDLFHAFEEYRVKMEFNLLCNQQHIVQVPLTRCQESAGSLIINVKFKTVIWTQPAWEEGRTQIYWHIFVVSSREKIFTSPVAKIVTILANEIQLLLFCHKDTKDWSKGRVKSRASITLYKRISLN